MKTKNTWVIQKNETGHFLCIRKSLELYWSKSKKAKPIQYNTKRDADRVITLRVGNQKATSHLFITN